MGTTPAVREFEIITARRRWLDDRLDEISRLENDGVLVGNAAARGAFEPERQQILDESDALLNRLDVLVRENPWLLEP
jgi:hypothetical protein